MGERSDLPSWSGYTPSDLDLESNRSYSNSYTCSLNLNSSSNPDCPYKTNKLGNVIGNKFTNTAEDLSNNVLEQYSDINIYTEYHAVKDNPISWDAYFMNVAILASLRSKDTTKVGSVLVLNKKLIGMGYNGFPAGIDESKLPTSRVGSFPDVKYAYTIHSEQNCILNSPVYNITGSTLYVTLFPCNECAKIIIQKGISEIVYLSDKRHDSPPYVASRRLLSLTNIVVRQYNGSIIVNV